MKDEDKLPLLLFITLVLIGLWSFINPKDRIVWFLEAFPVIIGGFLLVKTYRKFPFTNLSYWMIWSFSVIILVGAHYTYAEVPLFNMLKEKYDLSRNHYDRVGHLMQGIAPAIVLRELLLRTSTLRPGGWMFTLVIFTCLGFSAVYELLEFFVGGVATDVGATFLSMQGDIWDTQKDMALALGGAILALLVLKHWHNRQILERGFKSTLDI